MKFDKSKKEVWTGGHQGIGFEINHWVTPPNSVDPYAKDNWTYYIFLHIDRIPEQYKPNGFWLKGKRSGSRVHYDYYKHPVIGNLEFHCGITWYSKEHGFDGSNKVIKIGCDYQHYWDEGKTYDIDDLIIDVKNTIEDFRNKVSEYKYWCRGNGKLYDLKDGILKDESFYSKEYFGDKEWFKEMMPIEQEDERSVAI